MAFDVALTDAGYNQRVGRYGFSKDPVTGDVQFDETQAYSVMSSIAEVQGAYWADSTHGSLVSTLKSATQYTPSPTPSQASAYAVDALQPLVVASLIRPNPVASAGFVQVGPLTKLELDVSWQTPGGTQQNAKYRG